MLKIKVIEIQLSVVAASGLEPLTLHYGIRPGV